MSDEKVTACDVAQRVLDQIDFLLKASAPYSGKVSLLTAIVENPDAIAKLARMAGDPDYQPKASDILP